MCVWVRKGKFYYAVKKREKFFFSAVLWKNTLKAVSRETTQLGRTIKILLEFQEVLKENFMSRVTEKDI